MYRPAFPLSLLSWLRNIKVPIAPRNVACCAAWLGREREAGSVEAISLRNSVASAPKQVPACAGTPRRELSRPEGAILHGNSR
jgi:hypothetical protein